MRFDSITNKKTNRFKDSVSKLTEKYKNDITVEKEVTKPNIRLSDVPKININDIAEQSRGGITSAQIRKQANLMQQERIRAEEAQKAREEAEWHAKTPIQKVGTVVGKTLATPVAAMGELGTGVARAFEGFMDLGITGGGVGIGAMRKKRLENSQIMRDKLLSEGKISQQEADEWQRKINEEKIQDQEIDKATAKAIEYPIAENLLGKANREFTEKYSYLPTKAADISKTVGTILPSIGTGSELMASKPLQALAGTGKFGSKLASTASMIPFMGQATGMSTEEALREGADLQSAAKYGVLSGVVEGTIEAISGGIGGTTSNKLISKLAPETISKISNKVIAKYLPKLLDAGIDLTGEGAEEWLSTFINPYIKRLTYDEKAELSTSEERMEAFIDGVLASMVLKGATSLSKRTTPEGRIEALPEIDINTQNQLANINKNIEYQKQNEALANKQIQESVQNAKNNIENSKTTLTLPEGNRFYADEKGNVVTAQNYVAPRGQVQNQNSPVNTKQTIVDAQNNSQNDLLRQINTTLPTQAEMAQKANTEQINTSPNLATQKAQKTYQSAKIAGMTDVDMKKAIDLNNMLRSGANLEFYDEKNIPQNVQADKAKIANGFYKDGTLWINKNSKNKVEQILGHELTHHLETTNSYTDLSNTILDSDVFYDYISEKGYTNVAEYKTKLKEMGYTDAQMNNEMVARFVEEKLFTDQNSIDRLARQNTKLVEKIKNWISDLVVSFKGTAQEKELLRIENMYRKALDQARNTTASTETQYSYSGEVGLQNLKTRYDKMNTMQKEFVNELENNYQKALYLSSKGYKNDQILKETGWFESDGKWKWEIPDEYFKLKDNANLSNGEHDLSEIIDHDLIFMVYPELAKQKVVVSNNAGRSFYNTINDKIYLKIGEKTRDAIELSLLHELQHSIQNIEGFDGGTSSLGGMLRYYEKHGEIEASDTVRRFKQSKNDASFDRENVAPELSKENPKHPMLDKYLAGETKKQTPIRDSLYQKSKEKGNGIYEKIDRKAFGMEVDEANNGKDMRVDNGGRTRQNVTDTAGKEPAFSMPETDNQGRKLTTEQQEFFKDSKVRDEDGKLIEVYHGSANQFTVFDKSKIKTGATLYANSGDGFYFTDNEAVADRYSKDKFKYTTYLNITNPLVVENGLTNEAKQVLKEFSQQVIEKHPEATKKGIARYEEFDGDVGPRSGTAILSNVVSEYGNEFTDFLKAKGYDGIKSSVSDYTGLGEKYNYVAFEPNQIKNVDNTNPTENPDIRYSVNPVEVDKNTTKSQESSLLNEIAPIDDKKLETVEEKETTASILTKSPKRPAKDLLKQSVDVVMRKLVDAGNTINTVGKLTGDKHLYEYFNNTKQARQSAEYMIGEAQTDIKGNRVGNSLIRIFEEVRSKGDAYTNEFFEYLLHMHNIDRMAQNKPVFGASVTAEDSRKIANQLLEKHPEFEKQANKVYAYNRNLMQWRVDSGLISKEQADLMNEMYPHYVPTFRDVSGTSGSRAMQNTVQIANTVRKATGSNKNIMPIDASMARQTMQTVQAAKRNLLGNRLLNDALNNKDKVGEYIQAVEKTTDKADLETDLDTPKDTNLTDNNNVFKIFRNGETYVMQVNNGIYEGLKSISSEIDNTDTNLILKPVKAANNMFKKLITGYSPMFSLKNFSRDIQDSGLYSKELREFIKKYPNTYKEMISNGKMWQLYKSLGGTGSSFFDYETGIEKTLDRQNKTSTKIKDATLGKVEELNMMIEQAPRFAEFMATIEKVGNQNYDTLMEAMLNAADITVNFGRSGTWGKALNATAVPFFNPSIQGFDKFARTVLESRDGKKFAKLAIRATLLGILPSVINELLYWDDEEYENLTDRDKDTNFLIKVEDIPVVNKLAKNNDNKWLKIPKGRVLSIFGNTAARGLRTLKGEEWDVGEFFKNQASQTAPISVLESNIASPIQAVKNNKTWYGSDIVPQRLQDYAPKDQYDENTDVFSKWLGSKINYSPKKINYLIDAYTGIIGDVVLPLTTPKAETNPFTKAFVVDGVTSNEISNDFYNMLDKYNPKQNPKKSAKEVSRYLNKQSSQVSNIYKQIREVENSNISDDEKRKQVRELRELANTIELTAMATVPEYEKAVDKYRGTFTDEDVDSDYAYLFANRDVFGAEYAVKTFSKSLYNNHKDENMNTFFRNYFTREYFQKKLEPKETKKTTKNTLPTLSQQRAKLPTLKK